MADSVLRKVLAMHVLILWDVDHTLVENAGVSKEIYAAAFEALTGSQPVQPARTGGRTDRLIMRGMFDAHGLQTPPWPDIARALQRAGETRTAAMRVRGSVLPGVAEAIHSLSQDALYVQSVLTGNIRPNAEMKVSALGLGRELNFDIGAYGDDADDRAELVAIAQQRAHRAYGEEFDAANTVLIGDTPRDVDAGLRGGARVVAVATGVHTAEDLASAGASIVMTDLADTAQLRTHLNPSDA